MAQSTAPTPLDDLLLAALAGGRLAPGLRQRIRDLFIWLIDEETAGDRDLPARALADRLTYLYDLTRDPEPVDDATDDSAIDDGEVDDGSVDDSAVDDDPIDDRTADDNPAGDSLADITAPPTSITVVDDPKPAPESSAAAALRSLWNDLRAKPVHSRYCRLHGELSATGDLDEVRRLWKALHLVCLKLPRNESDRVTSAAQSAVSVLPADVVDAVPLPWAEGVPRLAEVISGVRARLASRPWADLLALVERFAWLAANDPGLQIGLQSIASSGELQPLTEDRIGQFEQLAEERLNRLAGERAESSGELDRLLELDELLRGLVPIPLPATDSWWAAELKRWTNVLSSHPQAKEVQILPLGIANFEPLRDQYNSITPQLSWEQTAEYRVVEPGRPVWVLRYARRGDKLLSSRKKGRMLIESA